MPQQESTSAEPQSAAFSYQRQAILSMSPLELVVKAYDIAIQACRQGDDERACRVLMELISALRFEYKDMATGLFRLYQYALEKIRSGDFDTACEVLDPLREAWRQAATATASQG